MSRFALVTYAGLPELGVHERQLQATLRTRGHSVDGCVWDDPQVAWHTYAAVIVRSCWDYHRRPTDFLAWVTRLEAERVVLWNSPATLRWNADKRYLLDLSAAGFRVVPTVLCEQGSSVDLAHTLATHGWKSAVFKPTIAATSYHTFRTDDLHLADAQTMLNQLLAERAMLIQPFVPQILAGEWSLIFFLGEYSHAILKRPAPGDFRSQDDFGGIAEARTPAPHLIVQAQQLVQSLDTLPLYARVDGVEVDGELVLMELELIEPGLFLTLDAHASERFADAIEQSVNT
jgi:glutathione synthase/RimK-type ligase-like ATP-grasp enzyme